MFVRSKMVANPFTVKPDDTVSEVQALLEKHGIKRVPVMDGSRLVGVVSREDIVRASPSKATSLSMGEITYLLQKTKVRTIMVKHPLFIGPDALLEEAATLMRDKDVGFLPVMENGKLVGVITASAIFDSFVDLLGFRSKGTRLTVEAEDRPGTMEKLGGIFARFDANITHIAVYPGTGSTSTVVLGINTYNTEEIERVLEENKFRVIYRLKNE